MYGEARRRTSGRGTAGSSPVIALSRSVTNGARSRASAAGAHESLPGGTHERDGLGEEHAHRLTQGDRLLVRAARYLDLGQGRRAELDGGVQRQRRELLALGLLHRLRLLLGEFAQATKEILGITAEREAERATTLHPGTLAQRDPVAALDLGDESFDRGDMRGERAREWRGVLAKRALETPSRLTHAVEVVGRCDPRRGADHPLERGGRLPGRVGPPRALARAKLREPRSELLESTARGELHRELAEDDDRGDLAHAIALRDGDERGVEDEPLAGAILAESDQVGAGTRAGLGGEDGRHGPVGRGGGGGALELLAEAHGPSMPAARKREHGPATPAGRAGSTQGERAVHSLALSIAQQARVLFAPLGPTYERTAALLSYGQDPRWRAFLVSRIEAGGGDRILDVATGTGAVARELRSRTGCAVVGLDQSPEMLAVARRRLGADVELVVGEADRLPFADGSFDGLTFTYLLRYVEDPPATLRELARVVRPGGMIAGLEFGVPGGLWRPLWELHVRVGLPAAGALLGHGWRAVGTFLGPSIRGFNERWPATRLLEAWREAGIGDVRLRRLSLGGGVVTWGRRDHGLPSMR